MPAIRKIHIIVLERLFRNEVNHFAHGNKSGRPALESCGFPWKSLGVPGLALLSCHAGCAAAMSFHKLRLVCGTADFDVVASLLNRVVFSSRAQNLDALEGLFLTAIVLEAAGFLRTRNAAASLPAGSFRTSGRLVPPLSITALNPPLPPYALQRNLAPWLALERAPLSGRMQSRRQSQICGILSSP